jgi:hypothetical protein
MYAFWFGFLQAFGVRHVHTAKLAAPQVVRSLAEAVLAAQLLDRHARIRISQKADDLVFGKPLLHVQSPSVGGLDSKSLRYSKPGGRRRSEDSFPREGLGVFAFGLNLPLLGLPSLDTDS